MDENVKISEAKGIEFPKKQNRCFYCGSLSYGKGCRYGPGGVHVHLDDPKKCCYCGSVSYGYGCKMNPHSSLHVHGLEFNTMLKEGLGTNVYNVILMKEMTQAFTEMHAFKMGLISETGDIVREPVTEVEKAALSPAMRTILRIKRFLGAKADLLNLSRLTENKGTAEYSRETHELQLVHESRFRYILNDLHEAVDLAYQDGLNFEQIEAIIQLR